VRLICIDTNNVSRRFSEENRDSYCRDSNYCNECVKNISIALKVFFAYMLCKNGKIIIPIGGSIQEQGVKRLSEVLKSLKDFNTRKEVGEKYIGILSRCKQMKSNKDRYNLEKLKLAEALIALHIEIEDTLIRCKNQVFSDDNIKCFNASEISKRYEDLINDLEKHIVDIDRVPMDDFSEWIAPCISMCIRFEGHELTMATLDFEACNACQTLCLRLSRRRDRASQCCSEDTCLYLCRLCDPSVASTIFV